MDSAATNARDSSEEALSRGTLLGLAALALGVFVIANDFTSLSVALPQIEHDLNADVSTVQWVINAYAFAFGVLIVTGGRLADMFGRRRIFFIGCAIFATFSLLGGLAPDAGLLIAARALMGIGGALIWPAVLGMTFAALPERRAGLAGALIIGVAGLGNALGPLVGGALTVTLSWRWILYVNVPIAAVACLIIWRYVQEDQPDRRQRIDYSGIAALTVALMAVLVALDQASDWGWGDWRTVVLLSVAAAGLIAFALIERGAGERALVPGDVVRSRGFVAACVSLALMGMTFFAMLMYLPQFMQKSLGFSPFKAGLGLLPMMATFGVVSFASGGLYRRLGPKLIVSAGAFCFPVGALLVSLAGEHSSYAALVPGMAVLGVGVGLFYSSVTTAAVTALDPSRASLASGIVYMFQLVGGSIGLALTTVVFTAVSQARVHGSHVAPLLTTAQEHAVNGLLAGNDDAADLIEQFPRLHSYLTGVAHHAFAGGFQAALRVDAALGLVGFLIALLFVGGRLRLRSSRREEAAASTSG